MSTVQTSSTSASTEILNEKSSEDQDDDQENADHQALPSCIIFAVEGFMRVHTYCILFNFSKQRFLHDEFRRSVFIRLTRRPLTHRRPRIVAQPLPEGVAAAASRQAAADKDDAQYIG
jgi:hypothetical protein